MSKKQELKELAMILSQETNVLKIRYIIGKTEKGDMCVAVQDGKIFLEVGEQRVKTKHLEELCKLILDGWSEEGRRGLGVKVSAMDNPGVSL